MKPRIVGVDLSLVVAAQLGFKLLGFAILTVLARGLGPSEFGFVMFALASCELAALATDFGSSAYLTREVAVAPDRAAGLLGEVLGIRLVLVTVYLALAAIIAGFVPADHRLVFLILAIYSGMKELSRAHGAVFFGTRRVGLGTTSFGSHLVLLAFGVWLVVTLGLGVMAVAWVYALAGIWVLAISWRMARYVGPARPTMRSWRNVVGSSLPLFGLGLLTMIQLRVDSSLLGLMRPYTDVATYEASARLFEASQSVVRPLTAVFLPIAAGLAAAGDHRGLRRSFYRLTVLALLAGVVTAVLVASMADLVILVVYGQAYAASAGVLRLHFAATPFVFVGTVGLFHLTALRRERSALRWAAAGLLLNVTLDLILIPRAGALGAAAATLAVEALTAIGLLGLTYVALARTPVDRADSPSLRGDSEAIGRAPP